MSEIKLTATIAAALLVSAATAVPATAELLDREKTLELFTGATGTHYYLGRGKHYEFTWGSDGKLAVHPVGAEKGDTPLSEGAWRIKTVEKKKGMSDEDVARANEALQFVYCHTVERMWSGNEMCWEVHQMTFEQDASKNPLPTRTYKVYREAGAETGEYIITKG